MKLCSKKCTIPGPNKQIEIWPREYDFRNQRNRFPPFQFGIKEFGKKSRVTIKRFFRICIRLRDPVIRVHGAMGRATDQRRASGTALVSRSAGQLFIGGTNVHRRDKCLSAAQMFIGETNVYRESKSRYRRQKLIFGSRNHGFGAKNNFRESKSWFRRQKIIFGSRNHGFGAKK